MHGWRTWKAPEAVNEHLQNAGHPLVSIIVPSFNQGQFIRRTLDSILAQDYRPIQVIVIDGASTDETVSILHQYDDVPEVEWVSEPDSGVVEAVNKGLARASGEIGGIQSSDDFYLPGAIVAAVDALRADPALAFVFGDIVKVDAEGNELARTQLAPYSLEGVLSLESWIPQPSTFFRLNMAKALGGWRESVPYAADTDLWFRMAVTAPAMKINVLMAHRSMHEGQRDRQGARIASDYASMVESLMPDLRRRGLDGAARAGTLLMANRYQPHSSDWERLVRLWRAALVYPKLLRRLPIRSLIPGRSALRASFWTRVSYGSPR